MGMYADRTHHGKEEDILFRDLEKKSLPPNHTKIINELVRVFDKNQSFSGRKFLY
jgi:hemerythrin-like domain-containing protein